MAHTKEIILDEALKLFATKGIRETTVRDIAKAVGITEGAIYRHFTSKDQIVYELFRRYSGELFNALSGITDSHRDPEEKFLKVVEAFMNFAFKNPDAFKFMNIFHYLRGSEVRRFKKLPAGAIRNLLEEMREKKLLKEDIDFSLAVMIGTLERVFLYKSMGMLKGKRKELITRTAENLWNYLVKCGES